MLELFVAEDLESDRMPITNDLIGELRDVIDVGCEQEVVEDERDIVGTAGKPPALRLITHVLLLVVRTTVHDSVGIGTAGLLLGLAGAAVAAWGAGAARTWFGGYGWAFGTSGLLCLFAVGLVTQIRRGPELVPVPVPA